MASSSDAFTIGEGRWLFSFLSVQVYPSRAYILNLLALFSQESDVNVYLKSLILILTFLGDFNSHPKFF